MRPVPTWKSTAAAPTPIRLGALVVPSAFMPWQVAQLAWKSFCPSSTDDFVADWTCGCSAEAVVVVKAAYAPPVRPRPMASSATVASG